jgi:hypothetical protein
VLCELWRTAVGAALATAGIGCFALQTRTNYWVMHSLWHLLVMSSSYFLMKVPINQCIRAHGAGRVGC